MESISIDRRGGSWRFGYILEGETELPNLGCRHAAWKAALQDGSRLLIEGTWWHKIARRHSFPK